MFTGICRMGHAAGETSARETAPRSMKGPPMSWSRSRGMGELVTGAVTAASGNAVELGCRSAPQRTTIDVADLYERHTST